MELVEIVILAVVIALVAVGLVGGLVVGSRKKKQLPPPPPSTPTITPPAEPQVGEEAETPRDEARRTIDEVGLPDATAPVEEEAPVAEAPALEVPEPTAGRLVRLRARLARSQNSLGKGLSPCSPGTTSTRTPGRRSRTPSSPPTSASPPPRNWSSGSASASACSAPAPRKSCAPCSASELITLLGPDFDREVKTEGGAETPGVVMVVGVNGTGKTTTTGKLARVLVADGRSVVLGAADTFRAAAADQLQTWGERVGARTVRGPEGGDPASIAYDAVKEGIAEGADVVLIDTAGRLHTKTGLMDELGKVKRVVEKHGPLDEVLLVLDATTGQNGLVQARVFAEVVDITGIVLTKLDGTAKGGIVIAVQRELGVPVKLIGLGEGPDDLAPFEPGAFVDALIGD